MGIEKKSVSARLSSDVVAELTKICEKENRTISNLIETIIKQFIFDQNKKTLSKE